MDRGPSGPVIFFDGMCVVCNGFVDFVMARDRRAVFRFAALQGETASGLLREGVPPSESGAVSSGGFPGAVAYGQFGQASQADAGNWMRSMLLRDKDGLHRKSDAALRVLAGLGGPWRWATWLRIIPRPLRDAAYDLIARNRYRWFGKRDTCRMPAPEERERFLP